MCFAVANVISKFVFSSLSSLFLWTRLTTILQMHCDLRPPKPRQFFSALITTPCQVWNRWTCLLPYYSILAADILLYAVTLTFDLRQLIRAWIITFLCWYVMLCCDIDLWPIDLQVHGTSSITWSKSVRNLSEIVQSAADILIILHTLCHGVTLTFDLLTS